MQAGLPPPDRKISTEERSMVDLLRNDCKIATFSRFRSVFKCNPGETNDKYVTSCVSNFLSYRREFRRQRKRRIVACTVRSLVMVREPVASAGAG